MGVDDIMNTAFPAPKKGATLKVQLDKIKLITDPEQTKMLLERLSGRIEALEDDEVYTEIIKADLREYVQKHLSADDVTVLKVLTGCRKSGKEAVAKALAEAETLPVPVSFLRDWAERSVVINAGGTDPGGRAIPKKRKRPEASRQPMDDEAATEESKGPVDGRPASTMNEFKASLTPANLLMMQMMVKEMMGSMGSADKGDHNKASARTETPKQRVERDVKEKVSKRQVPDFCLLGDSHKRRLAHRSTGFSASKSRLSMVNGILQEDDGTDVPEADMYNPREVRQGVARWIAECAKSDAYDGEEVADLLEWYVQVYALRVPAEVASEYKRAEYVKAFAEKHEGKRGWSELYDSDFMLANKHLFPAKMSVAAGVGGGVGRRAVAASARVPATAANVGVAASGPHAMAGGNTRWVCKAYYQRDFYGNGCAAGTTCKYEHACANCGGEHTAKACKSVWSKKRVEEKVTARGQRYYPTAFKP